MYTYSAALKLLMTSAAALVVAGCGSSGSGDKVGSSQLPVVHELKSQANPVQEGKSSKPDSMGSPQRAENVSVDLPVPAVLPKVPVAINSVPAVLPMSPAGNVPTGSERPNKKSQPDKGPVTKPIVAPAFNPEDEMPPVAVTPAPEPSVPAPEAAPVAPVESSRSQEQPAPAAIAPSPETAVVETPPAQPEEATKQDPPAAPPEDASTVTEIPASQTPPPTPPVPEPAPEPAPAPPVVEPEVPEVEAPPTEPEVDNSPVTGELRPV